MSEPGAGSDTFAESPGNRRAPGAGAGSRDRSRGLVLALVLVTVVECAGAAWRSRSTNDLLERVRSGPSEERFYAILRLVNRAERLEETTRVLDEVLRSRDRDVDEFVTELARRRVDEFRRNVGRTSPPVR